MINEISSVDDIVGEKIDLSVFSPATAGFVLSVDPPSEPCRCGKCTEDEHVRQLVSEWTLHNGMWKRQTMIDMCPSELRILRRKPSWPVFLSENLANIPREYVKQIKTIDHASFFTIEYCGARPGCLSVCRYYRSKEGWSCFGPRIFPERILGPLQNHYIPPCDFTTPSS